MRVCQYWVLVLLAVALASTAPLRPQSARPELILHSGHTGAINQVAYSPDGTMIASSGNDYMVKLWNTTTGELIRTLVGHRAGVLRIAFSPDGTLLASAGGFDRTIRIWETKTGIARRFLSGAHPVISVTFSHDGTTLASGYEEGTLRFWNPQTGKLVREVKEHSASIVALAYSPDGKTLASGADDSTVKLWDVDGTVRLTLKAHNGPVRALAFSLDGRRLATASMPDRNVKVWDAATGELKRTFSNLDAPRGAVFLPGDRLVTAGMRVIIWDTETGAAQLEIKAYSGAIMTAAALSPDRGTIATADFLGKVHLWKAQSGESLRVMGDLQRVSSVAVPSTAASIATFSEGVIRLWNRRTGVYERTLGTHTWGPGCLDVSPDGHTVASGGADALVKLWDLPSGQLRHTMKSGGAVRQVRFSPDGSLLANTSEDERTVRIWDVRTGMLRRVLSPGRPEEGLSFSPDGNQLATSGQGGIRLWEVQTGELKRSLPVNAHVITVLFSRDGRSLFSGGTDNTITRWEVDSGAVQHRMQGHVNWIRCLALSPDGNTLCSGSHDGSVGFWDAVTGALNGHLRTGHRHTVASVAFMPDGQQMVSASEDGTVRIRRTKDLSVALIMNTLPSAEAGVPSSDWMSITPDGYYDCSPGAGRYITWKVGADFFPVDSYSNTFHRPDLVRKALQGETIAASDETSRFLAGQAIPPQVAFVGLRDGQEVTGDSVAVEAFATADRKVARVELLVNGRPVNAKPIELGAKPIELGAKPIELGAKPLPASHKVSHRFRLSVSLPSGERQVKLRVIAYDDAGLQAWSEVSLVRKVAALVGDLHVLAVGVSRYANPKYDLKFASADALAFAGLWSKMQGTLYRRVNSVILADSRATSTAISAALSQLQQTVTDRDTVAIFMSGHGIQANNQLFYFASHNVDAASAETVARTGLPWTVFQSTLANLNAKRVLLFLDACHSGNTLGGAQANNERLASELLRRNTGVMVFASSRGSEYSYELDDRRHGAFTTALIEGISDGKADLDVGAGRDGVVTLDELLTYLRARVRQLTGNQQTPTCPLLRDFGETFPLAKVK